MGIIYFYYNKKDADSGNPFCQLPLGNEALLNIGDLVSLDDLELFKANKFSIREDILHPEGLYKIINKYFDYFSETFIYSAIRDE